MIDLLEKKRFKGINDRTGIINLIGSDNNEKFIEPLIKKRQKVSSCLYSLMFLSVLLAASSSVVSLSYETESNKSISEAKKLELSIKKNKVSQSDNPYIKQHIDLLKRKSKEDLDKSVVFGYNILCSFALLALFSIIGRTAHNCISEKRISEKIFKLYKNKSNIHS